MIPEWYAKAARANIRGQDSELRNYVRWEYGDPETAWLTARAVADSQASRPRRVRGEPQDRRGPFRRLALAFVQFIALKGPAKGRRPDPSVDGGPHGGIDEGEGHSSPEPLRPAELPTPRD